MAIIPTNLKLEMAKAFFLAANTYKMSLHTNSFVPDAETHKNFSDLTNEVSGTGYTAGGDDIGDPTTTSDEVNEEVKVDWDDYTFVTITVPEIRYAVIYKDTGTPSTSTIIGILDFGENKASVAQDFIVTINAHGVLNVT